MSTWRVLCFCGVVCAAACSGCIRTSSNTNWTGEQIGRSTFDQIEDGKTSRAWLTAMVGDPGERTSVDAGKELLTYKAREESSTSFKGSFIFPLVDVSTIRRRDHLWCFEIVEGLIVRHWSDVVTVADNSKVN